MGIHADDTRGVTVSWARLPGVSIPNIMDAAARPSTPVIFAKFYLKELLNLRGKFGQAVLSAGSSPRS